MHTKPTLLFKRTFVAITLLEIVGDTFSIEWLHYGCKPLIMGLLLWYVWQQYRATRQSNPIRWLFVGMIFALAGDVFLMIREVDLFAPGLGAFLIMQLCYSRAFWLSIRQQEQKPTVLLLWLTAIPFSLYDAIFLVLLRPEFVQKPALTALWWPVVGYVVCLSTMGILAIHAGEPGPRSRSGYYSWGAPARIALGALLFILSDSLIAIDKFLSLITGATWMIMSTYAAAQYLIVVGMTQSLAVAKR